MKKFSICLFICVYLVSTSFVNIGQNRVYGTTREELAKEIKDISLYKDIEEIDNIINKENDEAKNLVKDERENIKIEELLDEKPVEEIVDEKPEEINEIETVEVVEEITKTPEIKEIVEIKEVPEIKEEIIEAPEVKEEVEVPEVKEIVEVPEVKEEVIEAPEVKELVEIPEEKEEIPETTEVKEVVEVEELQEERVLLGEYVATGYNLSFASCNKAKTHPAYGITKNGYNLSGHTRESAMTIAVDPSMISLGTTVYVEFLDEGFTHLSGEYTARDVGGAIKGNRIDVFMGEDMTNQEVYSQIGKRKVNIYKSK